MSGPGGPRAAEAPECRPAKVSEFVRAIHGCLRGRNLPAADTARPRGDRIFSLPCAMLLSD